MRFFILAFGFILISGSSFAGVWGDVDTATRTLEDINEKQEKIDRLNEAKDKQIQRQRDKQAEKERRDNMKETMENQMCMQYSSIDTIRQAYKHDKKMAKSMEKQIDLSIKQMNIEYKKEFGREFDYKKKCD